MSVQFNSVQFSSVQFRSVQFSSVSSVSGCQVVQKPESGAVVGGKVAAKRCAGGGIDAGGGTALAAKLPVAAQLAPKLAAKMPVAAKLAAVLPVAEKLPVAAKLAGAVPVAARRQSGGKVNLVDPPCST
eukprot:gene9834-biopygen77